MYHNLIVHTYLSLNNILDRVDTHFKMQDHYTICNITYFQLLFICAIISMKLLYISCYKPFFMFIKIKTCSTCNNVKNNEVTPLSFVTYINVIIIIGVPFIYYLCVVLAISSGGITVSRNLGVTTTTSTILQRTGIQIPRLNTAYYSQVKGTEPPKISFRPSKYLNGYFLS